MTLKSNTLKTGLAMFAMFFGAGNVVYPLSVGHLAQDAHFWGILGLLVTAVGVPFLGLISVVLFGGDYESFFGRLGKWPGFILTVLILALIGPFGALPRTITLSFATTKMFYPTLSLPLFSFLSCILIYLLTVRKNKIIELIGTVLTPLLLLSLAIIIVKGVITGVSSPSTLTAGSAFVAGLNEGYQTMDLLATPFFSAIIVSAIAMAATKESEAAPKAIVKESLKASFIGGLALSLVYIGLGMVASHWPSVLSQTKPEFHLGALAIEILGPYAGIIACVAVALACLTTAIALSAVFADFLQRDLLFDRVSFGACLIITLVISYFFSTLEFTGIMAFLAPILMVFYPALITLAVCNILYKLTGFKWVKTPTLVVFLISLFLASF